MKLLCISADTEDGEPGANGPRNNKLRVWYNSIRKGLKRKEPRVTISEPIRIETLTQSDLIQINGVIDVKPSSEDENEADTVNVSSDEGAETSGTGATPSKQQETNSQTIDQPSPSVVESIARREQTAPAAAIRNESPPVTERASDEGTREAVEETDEQIVNYNWYWGSISRKEAEILLRGKKDGSFLVRASSDQRFLYSLSFRSNGKTMHTRIEHSKGLFFFYSNDSSSSRPSDGCATLHELISVAMSQNNSDSIFFYSRGMQSETSLHTVHLNQPLNRFQYLLEYPYESKDKKALQYMCKFVSHHCDAARSRMDQQLHSLPVEMRKFADNAFYFPRKGAR